MARIDELGEREDNVRLQLAGEDINFYGRYTVATSVFESPAAFTMTLSGPGVVKTLMQSFPPGTPCALFIGGRRIQSGFTDSCDPTVGVGGTTLRIDGRDISAKLFDAFVASERSFSNKSYFELVSDILGILGLQDTILFGDQNAQRKSVTG